MEKNFTNLCIKHLPSDFEKQDLVSLCSPFGIIRSAKIMFDLKTGKSKEFGFIRFESPLSAALALEKLNGAWISKKKLIPFNYQTETNTRRIFVSYAMSDENTGSSSNEIIVSSLPLFFVKKDIYDLFSKYGKILSIKMIRDTKRNRYHGRAIISYRTNEEAEIALKNLSNIKLSNDSWPLFIQYINISKSKDNKNQYRDDINTEESESYCVKSGIKIQKPNKKEKNSKIQTKMINENINNEEIYRNEQFENLMFKLIAEEY